MSNEVFGYGAAKLIETSIMGKWHEIGGPEDTDDGR
jgi:hypothetical protein